MTSKQQILEIEPATELRFMGPFTTVVSTELVLSNPTSDRVLFKIKTTAPRRYCVRPNSGHIGPKDKAIITIMLQPQDFDPAAEKNKHKFMVQSCIAPQDFAGEASMDQVWKDTAADRISDTKLKCTFVEESATLSTGSASGTNKSTTSQSSVSTLATARDGERDATTARSRAAPEVPEDDSKVSSQSAEPKSPPTSAPAPASAPASDGAGSQQLVAENERLRQQLANLQSEHSQLRQAELRLRSVAAQSSVDHATSTQPQRIVQPSGSSSKMYAIIAIVALLIGLMLGRFVL